MKRDDVLRTLCDFAERTNGYGHLTVLHSFPRVLATQTQRHLPLTQRGWMTTRQSWTTTHAGAKVTTSKWTLTERGRRAVRLVCFLNHKLPRTA